MFTDVFERTTHFTDKLKIKYENLKNAKYFTNRYTDYHFFITNHNHQLLANIYTNFISVFFIH